MELYVPKDYQARGKDVSISGEGVTGEVDMTFIRTDLSWVICRLKLFQ